MLSRGVGFLSMAVALPLPCRSVGASERFLETVVFLYVAEQPPVQKASWARRDVTEDVLNLLIGPRRRGLFRNHSYLQAWGFCFRKTRWPATREASSRTSQPRHLEQQPRINREIGIDTSAGPRTQRTSRTSQSEHPRGSVRRGGEGMTLSRCARRASIPVSSATAKSFCLCQRQIAPDHRRLAGTLDGLLDRLVATDDPPVEYVVRDLQVA